MQLRLEFQTTRKGSLTMMEYILKLKSLTDNLVAIGEPVTDRDQILQLLGGLGADYNSIVASLIAREDEMSLHSVHNIYSPMNNGLAFKIQFQKITSSLLILLHHNINILTIKDPPTQIPLVKIDSQGST